ncbi:MAG: tyrosine-type recombinase/integrase, partial [Bacilli bacterium]|nr:tyrosine-type recombinase/integrase [Bacilli bacterium]
YMPDYAIELAMLTGMRVGELAALSWDMLDENFIHIRRSEHRLDYRDKKSELIIGEPKNGKYRSIPITSEIRNLLNKIKTLNLQSEENFIFVREDGSRYTSHDISCAVNRRGKEVGIEKVSVHRVRRTVSSQLNYILPRKDVATLLGHSEKVNEEHYDYSLAEIKAKKQALSQVSVNIINFSDLVMKKKLKESV